ncbi:hypothetical protein [Streptomyces sp. NPDC059010]|uniref:hypothetical protein n=1 Tax=Streptomyces sp. NPDC059010 TaxID=3346695 RepID=UPI003675F028
MTSKWTPRWAAGFLIVGSVTTALLAGPVAAAQASELTPQCGGGCIQLVPDGFQVSSFAEPGIVTPQCPGGCAQSVPDGFQVSSTTGVLTTDGNWEPN